MVCVHPLYRGNRLAKKMNKQAIRLIKEKNQFDHLLATVSPYNYWNVDILLNSGFIIQKLKDKYGGKLRYIVYQDLKTPPPSPPSTDHVINLTDFQTQKQLFKQGFYGFRLCESSGHYTPIADITEPHHILKIPERFEIHFSGDSRPKTDQNDFLK